MSSAFAPHSCARLRRLVAAGGAILAVAAMPAAVTACAGPPATAPEADRCKPMDAMNDPSDGVVPSPEELLPDPNECPEFYEGDGDGQGAPPVSGLPALPSDPPGGEPVVPEQDACSETASLNGFPCTSTPSGPIYMTPDHSYPD